MHRDSVSVYARGPLGRSIKEHLPEVMSLGMKLISVHETALKCNQGKHDYRLDLSPNIDLESIGVPFRGKGLTNLHVPSLIDCQYFYVCNDRPFLRPRMLHPVHALPTKAEGGRQKRVT